MSVPPDLHCQSLGIPEHLHTQERAPIGTFEPSEQAYRRHAPEVNDVKYLISFRTKGSSVNRSSMSQSGDVLICDQTGQVRPMFVIRFPIDFFQGKEWLTSAGQRPPHRRYEVQIEHVPTRCNYAHCDLKFFEDGNPIEEITSGSVRGMIRDEIEKVIFRVIPEPSRWFTS
jgi:hypothetical protein